MPRYKHMPAKVAALVAAEIDRLEEELKAERINEQQYAHRLGLIEGWLRARGVMDEPAESTLLGAAESRRHNPRPLPEPWYREAS